ncbi:hypothetical protein CFP56_041146 [Quercus suber]|uniref:Uncharacterized protein n=1 Tax=Quercus suber TaxID=58331 RepID=A0AAW0IW40_QUESU
MIVGLSTLILSIATMMITFCAALFIILPGKSRVVIPIICLASVPVTLFAWMEFCLLIDMIISTYASRILDKKAKYGSQHIPLPPPPVAAAEASDSNNATFHDRPPPPRF